MCIRDSNIPGDPVGMAPTPAGSTVTVPVLMISDVDGQAISDVIKSALPGAGLVTVSYTHLDVYKRQL